MEIQDLNFPKTDSKTDNVLISGWIYMPQAVLSFGQWVRERRKQRKLTQKSLGKLIGYAEITIRQIEHDAYHLTRFVVESVVNCLAMEADDREAIARFALSQATTGDG